MSNAAPDPRDIARVDRLALAGSDAHAVRFLTDRDATLVVSSPREGILRLQLGTPAGPDYGILAFDSAAALPLTVSGAAGRWTIQAGRLRLALASEPLSFALERDGERVAASIEDLHFRGWTRLPVLGVDESRATVAIALDPTERLYGLGEKFGPLDRRGSRYRSYVEDALGVNTELAYKNIPFLWSSRGWGAFFHTPCTVHHGVGDPGWSHRSCAAVVEEGALDLFLLTGASPAELVDHYHFLTGRPAGVPRWSLGVWYSKAYYRTFDEALGAARRIRELGLPGEVINLDGRAWLDTRTRFAFEFDGARYPDPPAQLAQLAALGFRVCVWEYPYVSVHHRLFAELAAKGWLLKTASGEACVFDWDKGEKTSPFGSVLTPLPPSGIVDFTHPEAYAWYRDAHAALFAAGVDVLKVDFGEQVPAHAVAHNGDSGARLHSVYALLYNRCCFEATAKHGRGAPVIWGRAGWSAIQRHPVQWGGDPQSDWGGLAASIRGGLAYGLSGVPYWSTDVGGFYGNAPTPELFVRWTAAAVFASHFRFHGIGERAPWDFGERALAAVRWWLELRMRLLPYLERACAQAERGVPVQRALPYAFPEDDYGRSAELEFLFGEALLVAPMVAPGERAEVVLPGGGAAHGEPGPRPGSAAGEAWYDFWTGTRYDGGRRLVARHEWDSLPLFGREGYVVPLGPLVARTDDLPEPAPIEELRVFGPPSARSAIARELLERVDARTWRVRPGVGRVVALGPVDAVQGPDGWLVRLAE